MNRINKALFSLQGVAGLLDKYDIVIEVDISKWFRGHNGDDLDPNDPANTNTINENIEKSFEGFEDSFDDDDDFDDD